MIDAEAIPDRAAMHEQRLAERIRSFWHLAGYIHVKVDAWPVPGRLSGGDHHLMWGIRSSLVNGLPPGANPEHVATLYHNKRA
jgi:hypothetical protein